MSRTRLADLKPWWAQIYRDRHLTANNGGFPTGDYTLSFVCPSCGLPHIISVTISPTVDRPNLKWQATPMPNNDLKNWPELVTISTSIDNTKSGHRRGIKCSFHGQIINGEIVLS